jgi:hypothetical protein
MKVNGLSAGEDYGGVDWIVALSKTNKIKCRAEQIGNQSKGNTKGQKR